MGPIWHIDRCPKCLLYKQRVGGGIQMAKSMVYLGIKLLQYNSTMY